ncbi:MAG: dihydroorotate dehydrogenase electron transfer subunit [Muribaculaceae bacterium]|nr:dihydroorotate dehydrogenase electron transfer subunit [Roseburia sp.]MCM1431521.1 dihydroorotate dehydrogenase electron transfer subunit [Muribaculaceae bacterium]MCM1493814.1 dihydroorotate dehydrogenase electron transfer subunit [Muribaculaceae bacterium]
MDKKMLWAKVLSQRAVADRIYDMVLEAPEIAAVAKAGQFVSLYCADKSRLLPRPISLCGIDREAGTLRLLYRVTGTGTGTEEFSRLDAQDRIKIMGPLGNGFTVLPGKRALLIGGGIGVPPMLQLAKDIRAGVAPGLLGAQAHTEFSMVMGYRDAGTFLLDEFSGQGECLVATEDGSVGTKGNVLDVLKERGILAEVIYACGPMPMLRAIKAYAMERGIACYISMEERMACGIGACLACVCASAEKDTHTNVHNKRICKEGPVFDAREVEL